MATAIHNIIKPQHQFVMQTRWDLAIPKNIDNQMPSQTA